MLLTALLYFCMDLWLAWEDFSSCGRPIHAWLFVSILCMVSFRLLRMLAHWVTLKTTRTGIRGSRTIGGSLGEALSDNRHEGFMPRALTLFSWTIVAPFFTLWNFMGARWAWHVLGDTPECVPSTTYVWFISLWLGLCCYWFLIHAALAIKAFRLHAQVRSSENNLLEVQQDGEVLQRWGPAARAEQSLVEAAPARRGLSARQIKILPSEAWCNEVQGSECPVCMENFKQGEVVRYLPTCNHTFHRSCIDLWLVRCADCPLCKQQVVANTRHG